jgi:hypothetical protein
MITALWGEVRVAAAAPGAHGAPAHPFGLEDAAHLAAADLDALGLGGTRQGVQGPLRRLLLVGCHEGAVGLPAQPPGWVAAGQGDDPSAVQLPKPPRPARAGQIAKIVDAVGVEAVQPAVDRRRVAAKLRGDLADLGAVPAQGDDAGALEPARWRVAGGGELADAALFDVVSGRSGVQRRQHGSPFRVTRYATPSGDPCSHIEFEERSTTWP